MRRFVERADRGQSTLFPECREDWIDENNPVQVVDVFVDELDLAATMDVYRDLIAPAPKRSPWNKGKLIEAKPPLGPNTCGPSGPSSRSNS
jgi:transposase